jgi:outer membrane protein OmpA-like peptidoglycan-associated protein
MRLTAAAAFVTLSGCLAHAAAPAVTAIPPMAAPATQAADLAFTRRIDRFEALVSAPRPAAFMSEYLDVQPGQAPGLARPHAVIHIVYSDPLFFAGTGDAVLPTSSAVLDFLAETLKSDIPDTRLTLLIHTDAHGPDAADDDVSLRRARGILQALIARGIDPAALSAVVIGKRQPIAPNMTPQGATRNRRVEFLVSANLDANLAVVRLRPIDRSFLATNGAPAPTMLKTTAQVMRPEIDAAGKGDRGARITMRPTGTIELLPASYNPGPSPIPRQPILREGASNWPDPPEPPDAPMPHSN